MTDQICAECGDDLVAEGYGLRTECLELVAPAPIAELRIDALGRPLLANAAHKMHPIAAQAARAKWRDSAAWLCRAARLGGQPDPIEVRTWPEYPDRRSLPDVDATAPAVKGAIDGLVLAGVLADDSPAHLAAVSYLQPRVVPGCPATLVVQLWPARRP